MKLKKSSGVLFTDSLSRTRQYSFGYDVTFGFVQSCFRGMERPHTLIVYDTVKLHYVKKNEQEESDNGKQGGE